MKWTCLLLMAAAMAGLSQACSCTKRHPQEHYCSADFGMQISFSYSTVLQIFNELDLIIYQSIALLMLYNFVFVSVTIGRSVRFQIHENCGTGRHLLKTNGFNGRLGVERFVQSTWTQKNFL
jgi:Tissue inhibitor of metalloproteinase